MRFSCDFWATEPGRMNVKSDENKSAEQKGKDHSKRDHSKIIQSMANYKQIRITFQPK
jgi:hypothetical protein